MASSWWQRLLEWLRSFLFTREMELSLIGLQNAGGLACVFCFVATFCCDVRARWILCLPLVPGPSLTCHSSRRRQRSPQLPTRWHVCRQPVRCVVWCSILAGKTSLVNVLTTGTFHEDMIPTGAGWSDRRARARPELPKWLLPQSLAWQPGGSSQQPLSRSGQGQSMPLGEAVPSGQARPGQARPGGTMPRLVAL